MSVVAGTIVVAATAGEVSSEEAKEAVAGWASLREAFGRQFDAEVADVKTYEAGAGKFHVVSFEGGGYAVTSGDTSLEPVLAYSRTGTFDTSDGNPLFAMLKIDVAAAMAASTNASSRTRLLASASTGPTAQESKWARYRAASTNAASSAGSSRLLSASKPTSDLRVDYLVQSYWSQSGHGENYYTPNGYVCGCVATMGAQIMRYWQWPTASISANADYYSDVVYSSGTKGWNISGGYYASASASSKTAWSPAFGGTYDWANMPLAGGSSTAQKKAVGKLTRDVGLSCYMRYASGGSGAPGAVFGHRLVDQFGYANAKVIDGWNAAAALASFDAGLPCGMTVSRTGGGHAIVADGYGYSGDTLYVHFNMGWGSTGSSSTWYTPPSIGDYTSVESIIYNIYPPSKGASDLTIVSGRVLSGSSVKSGVTVTAVNRETGSSYSVTSNSKGIYALMIPAGFYTITATSGSSVAKVEKRVDSCLSAVYGGSGGRAIKGTVGNIHGLDLTLGTAVSAPSVSLAHRWSFTGNYSDSVGGSTATKIGSNVAIVDGKAVLSGNGYGKGGISLGTNLLNTDAATLEIWASHDALKNWSRVFDYGVDSTKYFCLSWSQGTDLLNDRAGAKDSNSTEVYSDYTMAPYRLGIQYHIAVTFERQTDGSTVVRWTRRDAASGLLQKTGSLVMAGGIHNFSNPVLYLGHSFYSSDYDANASYDEVRVWNGVVSDAQLAANAKAGPDVVLASIPSSGYSYIAKATWKGTSTPSAADLENQDNWTCYDENGNSVSGVPGARTKVVIPSGGTTAFSIPSGYTPNWRKVQVGGDGCATVWGTKAAANSNFGAMMDVPASSYTINGSGSVSALQRGIVHNPSDSPADLQGKQLRYDGWFYVDSYKCGHWSLHSYIDDYIAFKVDDEWALQQRTMGQRYGAIDVTEGWHRFTLIVGDTGGGYGGCVLASNAKLTPLAVKINGGAELAFSPDNFTFGSSTKTVKLAADCDWRALDTVSIDNGTTIDLNGHELRLETLTASFMNAKVTNSSSDTGTLLAYTSLDTDNVVVDGSVTVATETTATPTCTPAAGSFTTDALSVTLACGTSGATIYYTLDGTEPTKSSAQYTAAIVIDADATIKARAFKSGMFESEILTAAFTQAERTTVPAFEYDASKTNFYGTATLGMTAAEGQVIRYTTDGSDPTAESTVYTGSIAVTNTTTVKASAFKDGFRQSEVVSVTFTKIAYWGGKYPDTPESRAQHWIEESEAVHEATGKWSTPVVYDNGRIAIDGDVSYEADTPSAGGNVVVVVNTSFNSICSEEEAAPNDVKAAICIGIAEATDDPVFQVFTRENDERKWLDVEGVDPVLGYAYNVKFDMDFTNRLYSVAVSNDTGYTVLSQGARTKFPFACDSGESVRGVVFSGHGSIGSILGSYGELVVTGFVEGEEITVGDAKRVLEATQAAWLNGLGARAVVSGKIQTLSAKDFDKAYLLNLDVTKDGFGAEFKVTEVTVGTDTVEIKVTLTRTGAVMDGEKAKPINGTLLFKGAADIASGFKTISTKTLSDNDFSDGDTATATFDKVNKDNTENKFFKANIE